MRVRDHLQAGDTIVEVIIAIAVIATVLTGAFVVSSRSLTGVRDSQEHSDILQQLQGQAELLRVAANTSGFFNSVNGHGQYECCPNKYSNTPCTTPVGVTPKYYRDPNTICVTDPFCLGYSNGIFTGYPSQKPPFYKPIVHVGEVVLNPSDYYNPLKNKIFNQTCFPNSTYSLGLSIIECYNNTLCTQHPLGGDITFRLMGTWLPISGSAYDSVTLYYSIKVSCTGTKNILTVCGDNGSEGKPVIYLYPQRPENVSVNLKYVAGFSKTVPSYNPSTGWQVFAKPDGTLLNKSDNKTYPYLYWEGNPTHLNIDMSTGFVVAGKDTKQFLALELPIIGLNQNETNAFLAYWVPRMDSNKFNLIHFAGHDYTSLAPLNISPKPDSLLRVNMIFKPLQTSEVVTPQTFPRFYRNGFTVVEWGGAELF